MDEQVISAQERLKQITAERKTLREQVKTERSERLAEAAKSREGRDEKIEAIQDKLKQIQKAIYLYNKLGKVSKMQINILEQVATLTQ